MKRFNLLACCAIAAFSIFGASAARADNTDYLTFGAGAYDVFHDPKGGDFRLEYQPAEPHWWLFRPLIGTEVTTRGSIYGYAGVMLDWNFAPHWYLTPSFAPGIYFPGSDRHLGGPLEFRSQLEGSYEFDAGDRLGVALSHESNASIYNHNPGAEAVVAYYHMPLWRLLGGDGGDNTMHPSTGGSVAGPTGSQ